MPISKVKYILKTLLKKTSLSSVLRSGISISVFSQTHHHLNCNYIKFDYNHSYLKSYFFTFSIVFVCVFQWIEGFKVVIFLPGFHWAGGDSLLFTQLNLQNFFFSRGWKLNIDSILKAANQLTVSYFNLGNMS